MIRRMLIVLVLCIVAASARADNAYEVIALGMFDKSAPVSDFTAPNTQWRLSFYVGIGSPVTGVDENGFNVTFSNFQYYRGGSLVKTTGPTAIRFYTFDSDGLFDVQGLSSTKDSFTIALFGDQAFSGTTDNPTLERGLYPVTGGGLMLNGNPSFQDPEGSRVLILTVGYPAEPSSVVLMGSALPLLRLAWRMRRRVR